MMKKLARTDEGPAPKAIGCTPGTEARQHVRFQEISAGNLFGHGEALDSQQWLVNMTDLLKAIRIPDENQVEMTKIQLKDVAKTWWLEESARLEKLITWDQFSRDFYEKILLCKSLERNERMIYQIAVKD